MISRVLSWKTGRPRLDYQVGAFPRDDDEGLDDTLKVLEMLTRIEDIKIGIRSGRNVNSRRSFPVPRGSTPSEYSRWTHSIRSLVQRPTVRTFRLKNIVHFPLDALSGSVRTLCLQRASCDPEAVEASRGSATSDDHQVIQLKTLNCEDADSLGKVDQYLRAGGLALSSLKNLHIATRHGIDAKWAHLLKQARSLRHLHISVSRRIFDGPLGDASKVDGFSQPPWEHIHPSSLDSLSHLKLTIQSSIIGNPTPIPRPYTGLLSDSFLLLAALEDLEVDVVLIGVPRIRPENFSASEWQRLPDVLGKNGSFPKLPGVSVRVRADLFDYDEKHAQILVDEMAQRTFPCANFQSLLNLRPGLDLSFVVGLSMGLQSTTVYQRTPYMTYRTI